MMHNNIQIHVLSVMAIIIVVIIIPFTEGGMIL